MEPDRNAYPVQLALMPANLITLAHFSVSSAMSLPKSAGEPPSVETPTWTNRAFMAGSASAALISLLSLSTMSEGVPLGAPIPKKPPDSIARHELGHGRHIRKNMRARRGGDRQRAHLAGSDVLDRHDRRGERDQHLSADEVGHRRSPATIGHVGHVDAGHRFEQLAGHMRSGPDTRRRHAELSRIGLRVSYELGDGLGRDRWMHHEDFR